MSKYDKLWKYIGQCSEPQLTLTYADIARLAGVPIDHSFLNCKKELTEYGYEVGEISMKNETVTFHQLSGTLVLYVHGKGGTAQEAEHYKSLFPDANVVGLDYTAAAPWEAEKEFPRAFSRLTKGYSRVILIANSIGAYFSMCALPQEKLEKAYFISPVVDMEKLICNMMVWAGVTEPQLEEAGTIETSFGEALSWEYLCYVRSQPIRWTVPTSILYGSLDNLTSYDTISAFAGAHNAQLTVMEGGEHWFHTPEQMIFLDNWITGTLNTPA